MKQTVFQMVGDILVEAETKLASYEQGHDKTASANSGSSFQGATAEFAESALDKIAEACEYVSNNFHLVFSDPTP